jgi:hypothetical protein
MTTQEDIRAWLRERQRKDITHMLVVCDTFDHEDYPVYVTRDEDVRETYRKYEGKNMQRVMEVYSFGKDLEVQLNEGRAFHFD